MEKNLEIKENGLKCDSCDWKDTTILFADYENWINKPCPMCGANVLTQEDYNNMKLLVETMDFINELTEEEINAIASLSNIETLKESDWFKFVEGKDNVDYEKAMTLTLDVKNGKIEAKKISNED